MKSDHIAAHRIYRGADEAPARNRLKEMLADCNAQFPLQLVGEASNGQEALDRLAETPAEVVLMDIRMPQMDGIELARHLNKLDHPPVIIFTTAYDAYAVQAFEQRAVDYLLKPIRLGRLFDALSAPAMPCRSVPKSCKNSRRNPVTSCRRTNAAKYC